MIWVKKLFLILIVLFCPLGVLADDGINAENINQTTISAPKHFEKDFVKNDIQTFNIIQNNSKTLRKEARNFFGGLNNNCFIAFLNKTEFTLNLLSIRIFEKNKSNIISFLSFQIQPNAP